MSPALLQCWDCLKRTQYKVRFTAKRMHPIVELRRVVCVWLSAQYDKSICDVDAVQRSAGCQELKWDHDVEARTLHVQPRDEDMAADVDLSMLSSITSQMVSLSS